MITVMCGKVNQNDCKMWYFMTCKTDCMMLKTVFEPQDCPIVNILDCYLFRV